MIDNEIQVYLSAALDQEACKATLLAALKSRVDALRRLDVPDQTILTCLENLIEVQYQINEDVIEEMIELVIITSQQSQFESRRVIYMADSSTVAVRCVAPH